MPKNFTGGNKSKGKPNKKYLMSKSGKTPLATDECYKEMNAKYALVTSLPGNSAMKLLLNDGRKIMGRIGGRFSRRSASNLVTALTIVLIGEYEDLVSKAELLYIYDNKQEKELALNPSCELNHILAQQAFLTNKNHDKSVAEDFDFGNTDGMEGVFDFEKI